MSLLAALLIALVMGALWLLSEHRKAFDEWCWDHGWPRPK